MKYNMQNIAEINLKNLFKTLIKRKIAFLISFIIVFAVCLTFLFLASPEYISTSQITISNNDIFYNETLYKYFPEEADDLWIIPSNIKENKRIDYIVGKLDSIDTELKSDVILNDALDTLNGEITKSQLIKSINVSVDRWIGTVAIESYAGTSDLAYNTNKSILDSYVNKKKIKLEKAYDALLEKIEKEIELSKKEIKAIEDEYEKESFKPLLNEKLHIEFEKYYSLNTIRQNMTSYKNLFIDRIRIIKSPSLNDVNNTSSFLRNILLSFIAAIVIGIISAFTVNYFKNSKS